MPEKKQTVPFSGTKEQEEALLEVIAGLKDSAFLERFARENFLMHRPGEVIYLIDEK